MRAYFRIDLIRVVKMRFTMHRAVRSSNGHFLADVPVRLVHVVVTKARVDFSRVLYHGD